jgi:hypothetical protein
MALLGGLVEQRRDMTPRCVKGTACTCSCQSIKCLGRGSRYGSDVPVGALERGGPLPRGHPALERGGPRPRGWSALERGGLRPRGRLALERGGVSPEGAWANCFGGPLGPPGSRLCCAGFRLANLFMFAFFTKEGGFPRFFKGPLCVSPTVAPEHLRGYPLGSRRC